MFNNTISANPQRFKFLKKSTLIILAKIIIASGLLVYLVYSVEYDQIVYALNQANILIIGIVILLWILNVYLQYYKWRITCEEVLEVKNNLKVFRSLFYGFSAGIITPLRVGEYFGRGIEFKDKSLIQVTVATLIDKFFPLMMVASLGSVSSLFFIYYYYGVSIYIVLSLFILLFTTFYLIFVLVTNKRFWNSILFLKLRSSSLFNSFQNKLAIFEKLNRHYFYKMLGISFLFYSCYLIQYALLVMAFSNHSTFVNYLWAANLIMFVKTIIPPISLGELGIREGASVFFISKMGEVASVGFNSSIFLFIINLLIPALIGVGMFMRKNDK